MAVIILTIQKVFSWNFGETDRVVEWMMWKKWLFVSPRGRLIDVMWKLKFVE